MENQEIDQEIEQDFLGKLPEFSLDIENFEINTNCEI